MTSLATDEIPLVDDDKSPRKFRKPSQSDHGDPQGFNLKAFVVLVVWYVSSFIVIILNKRILDGMKGDPTLLSSIQMAVIAFVSVFQLYHSCGMYKSERRKTPYPSGFFRQMLFVGALRFLSLLLGIVSLKYVAVSFTETIKCSAPVFTVLISYLLVGEKNGVYVMLSLLPIMLGLALCSAYELSFNVIGFVASLATNITECAQFVYSKVYICGDRVKINPAEFQLFTGVASVIFGVPVCLLFVDRSAYVLALEWDLLWATIVNAFFYYIQTITSFVLMIYISPVTHSVTNTVKRALMIWASVLVFNNAVTLLSALGTLVVFTGVLLYNWARRFEQGLRAGGGGSAFPLPVVLERDVDL